jgi:hypothetical protein
MKSAFENTDAEAFCQPNSDKKNECDVYINDPIPFLSLKIFKIVYNKDSNLAVDSKDT